MEYIEKLEAMVLIEPEEYWKETDAVIGDGIHVDVESLKVYLHVYELSWGEAENVPTAEQVLELYNDYNEQIDRGFTAFYSWFHTANGKSACDAYKSALFTADRLYRETNGAYFFGDTPWSKTTAEQLFALEEYVREHPDYSETDPEYQRLLKWLGLGKAESKETE